MSKCNKSNPFPSLRSIPQLLQLAATLPSLLHEAEHSVSACRGISRPLSAASRLQELDRRFAEWFKSFGSSDQKHTEGFRTTFGVSNAMRLRDLPIQPLSPTFRRELYFKSHHSATVHAMYWQCLLLLRTSMQKLRVQLSQKLGVDMSTIFGERDLEAESCACASLICRSFPYLLDSASENVLQAASVRLPIYLVKEFFASGTGYEEELEWCVETEMRLTSHFESLHWDALLPWTFLAIMWQPFESDEGVIVALQEGEKHLEQDGIDQRA